MKLDITPTSRQRGATLLEALGFLGIAGAILVGSLSLLNIAFSSTGTNRTTEELSAIVNGTKGLFMGQNSYGTGSLNTSLATAKVFPSTLSISGATVTNAWGGPVTVTGATTQYTITYTLVPADVCMKAISTNGSAGFVSVAVNAGTATTPPITPSAAAAACDAATNTIVWTAV